MKNNFNNKVTIILIIMITIIMIMITTMIVIIMMIIVIIITLIIINYKMLNFTSSLCRAILKCLKNRYSFSSPSPSRPAYFSIASYPNESNDRLGFKSRHVGVLLVWAPCSFTQSMFIKIASLP